MTFYKYPKEKTTWSTFLHFDYKKWQHKPWPWFVLLILVCFKMRFSSLSKYKQTKMSEFEKWYLEFLGEKIHFL